MIRILVQFIITIIAGLLLFFMMQFSLLYLKDQESVNNIEEPEYYMVYLNRSESEYLLREKAKLMESLKNLEKREDKGLSYKEKEELRLSMAKIQREMDENSRKLEKNKEEKEDYANSQKIAEEKTKEVYAQLTSKNSENAQLRFKLDKAEQEVQNVNTRISSFYNSSKDKLNEIYQGDRKSLTAIEKAYKSGTQDELILNELAKITNQSIINNQVQENEKQLKELKDKHRIEVIEKNKEIAEKDKEISKKDKEMFDKTREIAEINKEIAEKNKAIINRDAEISEKNKEIANLKKVENLEKAEKSVVADKVDLSSQIKGLETVIDKEIKRESDLFKEYQSFKSTYRFDNNHERYMTNLTSLISKIIAVEKQNVADREAKNTKNAQEIMKLLKTIDDLKKQ